MDNKQFLNTLFNHSSDGILLLDGDLSAIQSNTVFKELTGYENGAVSGRSFDTLFPEIHGGTDHSVIGKILTSGTVWQGELSRENHRREARRFDITIFPLSQSGDSPSDCLAIVKPLPLHESADGLDTAPSYDSLTGLPGPAIFLDRVEQALHTSNRAKHSVALLLVDIDRFALINAGLGREQGDLALREISRRITSSLRETDSAIRITGDIFCLLLKVTADDHSALVAEKVLQSIRQPLTIGDQHVVVSASIGISTASNAGETTAALMEHCESALHHAKTKGGNCFYFFAENLNKRAKKRLELEHDLLHALGKDEFTLFYQPKVDVNSQAIVGMEALIRWQHPRQGLIPPAQFIQVAEETGHIVQIGNWVLCEACRQNKQWQDEGLADIPVSVNVSPRQFQVESFSDEVHGAIESSGLAPKYLELEITENMLMDDIDQLIAKLKDLKDIGLSMAIDDFGTGYSNLSYLTRFPVSTLKIDRVFIKKVKQDADIAAITKSIINLSHSLSMNTVAEGAEIKEHVDFLRANNCNTVQGNYYSKALPADEFAELLRKGITKDR